MNKIQKTGGTAVSKLRRELSMERKKISALSPDQALSRILGAPQPAALVHSYPEQDFHLLIHEIGVEDCLPILQLASNRQWEYLLDAEVWEKDHLDIPRMTQWLERLLRADGSPARFSWLLNEKMDLLDLYLFRSVDIRVRNQDEDPSDFGEGFISLDGVLYFRIKERNQWALDAAPESEEREPYPAELLRRIASHNYGTYQKLILEAGCAIAAELEEEAYRWRNVRLSEKGIPPFEEAVGIYQPISMEFFHGLSRSLPPKTPSLTVSEKTAGYAEGIGWFEQALESVDHRGQKERIQFEFAVLANQIIIADQLKLREPENVRSAVRKACGYINLGLDSIIHDGEHKHSTRPSQCLIRYPLMGIFRMGWTRVVRLKQRAVQWVKNAWFTREGFPLGFWGEEGLGIIGGLLLKRPRCYDAFQSGSLYREFESSKDLEETTRSIERIMALDHLLSRIPMTVGNVTAPVPVSYKNLLLTLWVRDSLGLPDALEAIPLERFRDFFKQHIQAKAVKRRRMAVSEAARRSFDIWILSKSDVPRDTFTGVLSEVFNDLFNEIAKQLGSVSPKDLDPRFVDLFLLKAETLKGEREKE